MVATRPDVASVDMFNFLAWARQIVLDLKDLTDGNLKVLLLYDGYRSHMSLVVLELFRNNNFIAYALPTHTSGTTQPLDVGLTSPCKYRHREIAETFVVGKPLLENLFG